MHKIQQILFIIAEAQLHTTKRPKGSRQIDVHQVLIFWFSDFVVFHLQTTVHRSRTNPTNRYHSRFGAHWHCPFQCTVSATGMMYGTVSGLAYGHLVCYSVSAPNPCNVNKRLPPSLTTQNWNCISRCPRYLMVCISESITDALRHQENRCIQHSTYVPLWLTVAEIGRTLSKPVKFVLADKKSEHKRNATPFGKRNKNRKSKTNPLPRIMNHMVERDSQNDVPEEMDITEGMKPQQLLMLYFVYELIHISLIILVS